MRWAQSLGSDRSASHFPTNPINAYLWSSRISSTSIRLTTYTGWHHCRSGITAQKTFDGSEFKLRWARRNTRHRKLRRRTGTQGMPKWRVSLQDQKQEAPPSDTIFWWGASVAALKRPLWTSIRHSKSSRWRRFSGCKPSCLTSAARPENCFTIWCRTRGAMCCRGWSRRAVRLWSGSQE